MSLTSNPKDNSFVVIIIFTLMLSFNALTLFTFSMIGELFISARYSKEFSQFFIKLLNAQMGCEHCFMLTVF